MFLRGLLLIESFLLLRANFEFFWSYGGLLDRLRLVLKANDVIPSFKLLLIFLFYLPLNDLFNQLIVHVLIPPRHNPLPSKIRLNEFLQNPFDPFHAIHLLEPHRYFLRLPRELSSPIHPLLLLNIRRHVFQDIQNF